MTRICKTIERNSGSIDWHDFEDDSEDRLPVCILTIPASGLKPTICPEWFSAAKPIALCVTA